MIAEIRSLISELNLNGEEVNVIVQKLNEKTRRYVSDEAYTVAGLVKELGFNVARNLIEKFKTYAQNDQLLESLLDKLNSTGIVFSDPDTQSMLESLASQGVFTQSEVDLLKNIGVKSLSPAEERLGEGYVVTLEEVQAALSAQPDRVRVSVSVHKDQDLSVTVVEQPMYGNRPFDKPTIYTWRSGQPKPDKYQQLIDSIVSVLG